MNPDAKLTYPRIVMIQTTSRCNSACIMCPWPKVAKELPQGVMDDALYSKILEEISGHPEIEMAMPYLMNEPLIDPQIVERINLLKEAAPQATVYLLTNGVALTDNLTERLLASKLDWIGFSIHALRPETYKQITGRGDGEAVIKKVSDFVRRAQDAGKHKNYVMVTFTRMRPHVSREEADEAVAYWKDLGVDPVDYQDGYISRAGNVSVECMDAVYRPNIIECKTVWAYKIINVLYNGDVVPCCMDWNREVVWGNLRQETMDEIWSGANRGRFLEAIHSGQPLPPGFLCSRCEEAVPALEQAGDVEPADDDEKKLMAELEQLLDEDDDSEDQDLEPRTCQPSPEVDTAPDAHLCHLEERMATLARRMDEFLARRKRDE